MAKTDVADLYEARSVRYTGGEYKNEVFNYRLLKPDPIEPGREYPLLLFLHGRDSCGDDNLAQLKYLPTWMASAENRQRFPCFLVAPQCRADKQWVETPRATDRAARPRLGPQLSVVINVLDDVARNFPIDENRMYVTGLSLGGYASWELGTRLAERWAAVAPICGGGDDLFADRLVDVPVWAWHGDADDVVPVRKSQRMIDAIRKAGGNPRFKVLEGVGHDSWTPAYTDPNGVIPWMFGWRKVEID